MRLATRKFSPISVSEARVFGLGFVAQTYVSARSYGTQVQRRQFSNTGVEVARWMFQQKNKYLGMPVKFVGAGQPGVEPLKFITDVVASAHDAHHKRGLPSGEKALDAAFASLGQNPELVCKQLEQGVKDASAPFITYFNEESGQHEYVVVFGLELTDSMFTIAQTLTHERVLTGSAKKFPGGFEVTAQGTAKMPRHILLAGGDNVEIKGHVPIPSGFRVGGFYQFLTRYHSLHGMLIHGSWLNMMNRTLYVARVGIGEAPKLKGEGMGVLDLVNVVEGPHVWTAADLAMVRELFGEEVFQELLARANAASKRTSKFGFGGSYLATGLLSRYGGKVARPTKNYVLPWLRGVEEICDSWWPPSKS